MKFTLKTLQRESFEVELDENLTVADLKKKIEEEKGAGYAAANLKLIYAGKILSDEKVMKEYDISAFIVVMVSKPKPAPTQTEGSSSSTPSTTTPAAPTPQPTTTAAAPPATETAAAPPPVTTTAPVPAAGAPAGGDSMMVQGPEYEAAVSEMVLMGFERAQVERAMAASFMNPNRAVDYLINPGSMPTAAPPPAAPAAGEAVAPAVGGPPPAAEAPAAGGGAVPNLDFLRNQPQMVHLRQMISQNPGALQGLLEEVGQVNPGLLQAIQENPQQFINLLNEGGGATGGQPEAQQQQQQQQQQATGPTVQISTAEKEAIDRIKALGFPEHLVIQAYFACEKNENLAAEFLFSENFQDDAQ